MKRSFVWFSLLTPLLLSQAQAAISWGETITAGQTEIKADHINEIRTQVQNLESLIGGAGQWVDGAGGVINYGGGNVGIGVTNPVNKLAVRGSGVTTWSSSGWQAGFGETGAGEVLVGTFNNQPAIQGQGTGTSYRLLLNPYSGNVGIGTTNPQASLHVQDTSDLSLTSTNHAATFGTHTATNIGIDNNEIMARNNGAEASLYLQNDGGDLVVHNAQAGGTQFIIRDNGTVGIGTTNPSQKLTVEGDITSGGSNTWQFHTPDDGRRNLYFGTASSTAGARAWPINFNNDGTIAGRSFNSTAANATDPIIEYEGGHDLIQQSSARGGIQIGSKDDSVFIGNGDVAHELDATYFNPEAELVGIASDDVVRIYTGAQPGWASAQRFDFNTNGELDIPVGLELGANASRASTETAEIRQDYTGDSGYTQLTINPTIGNATLSANRSYYGINTSMTNNQAGTASGSRSSGYGVRGYVVNSGGAGASYYNAGGTFEGRNVGGGMTHARGAVGVARQYDDDQGSNVAYAYGLEGQAIGRSNNSTNAGNITHARGLTAVAYPYASDITNADGVNGYVSTNNSYGGSITTAYGVRGAVRNDSDDGSAITTAFGGHFTTSKRASANNIGTAYGVYASATAGNTNYGIYSNAGTNYFAEAVGIGPGNNTVDTGLLVDVAGKIGATEYCDENGANCVAAASLGSGGGGSGSGGSTMVDGWPDAIHCNMTSPNWGEVTFYLQYAPYIDGDFWYRTIQSSGDYSLRFNSDGSFDYDNFTSNCDNQSIAQLYASGEAFNFVGGGGAGSSSSGGGDGALIDKIASTGQTVAPVTIIATGNKWPDYVACDIGSGVRLIYLDHYGVGSVGETGPVYSAQYEPQNYYFNDDGSIARNGSGGLAANCGASAGDINSICNDGRCGFLGGGSGGGVAAWVTFDGTGTPSINGASNVSSITDLGTGVWRVNFTNPMPNTDYAVSISAQVGTSGNTTVNPGLVSKAVDSVTIQNQAEYTGGGKDSVDVNVVVFSGSGGGSGGGGGGGGISSCTTRTGTGTATCLAGETRTGGGCSAGNGSLNMMSVNNRPTGTLGWQCSYSTGSGGANGTAYAICCN